MPDAPAVTSVIPARHRPGDRVAVMLPLPLAEPYDYVVPQGLSLRDGDFVNVPLGRRHLPGVVWGKGTGGVAAARLRAIAESLPAPPLPEISRRFVAWVAQYTVQPLGAVLRMAMSVPAALRAEPPVIALTAGPLLAEASGDARKRVAAVATAGPPRPVGELARAAGVSPGVVRAMLAARQLMAVAMAPVPWPMPDFRRAGLPLSTSQAVAAATLRRAVGGGFGVTVLDGVPGAGKTEVYFEAIAETLAGGRQALVLLPEIALSAQWLDRFRHRFGVDPAVWHSELTPAQRRRNWRAVANGEASVVVGARSALFLPFVNLGLIIVDEEHDPSFKQDEGVAYHARDMAVVRAQLGDIPIALVSATPSLETVVNVREERYRLLRLPERHGAAALPAFRLLDLTRDRPPRGGWLAPSLREDISQMLNAGSQVLLFLNRRGYAPLTLCRACGHRLRCPACTAWLVEHRGLGRLLCHHCGYGLPTPHACPACGVAGVLAACGPGVERLDEEVAGLWPRARRAIATSDTINGPTAAADLVRQVEDHEVDIVIGTQIITKGYHFPLLALVGVVDADLGLTGGDLRAAERTFQVLYQVAGRAGRGERAGRAVIQTVLPDHPVMIALAEGDRDRFMAVEEAARRAAGMPPFGRLAALIVSGRDEPQVDEAAAVLARVAPRGEDLRVLGPAPAPMALLRGQHRRRLLLHARRSVPVSRVIHEWLGRVSLPSTVRAQVDVDPLSFL